MDIAMWQVWVIGGFALLIAEIFSLAFVLGVLGVACFGAALLAAFGLSFHLQLLGFGVLAGILSLTIRPMMLKCFGVPRSGSSTNVEALIGQTGHVLEDIDPRTNSGRVKLGGDEWKATTVDGAMVEKGERVIVRKIEGCTLLVELATNQGGTT
jgi:membrane protein implicated in regulation of membrane protease activity